MSRRLWLPALAALVVAAAPAAAQDGLGLTEAIDAALASHSSVVQARAALASAGLALRLAEIDHSRVTVTVSATPAAGSVNLSRWEDGTFDDVVDTFDADASGTLSAQVELPWGMKVAGSYTAGVELDDLDTRGTGGEERFTDAQSLSVSQDLLPAGRLAPTAVALAGRRDDERLARLRLRRAETDVAQQVARTFLDLIERTAALAVAEERQAIAERELVNTQALVEQQATDRIALLGARITAIERRDAAAGARAALTLDTAAFFADLDLPQRELAAPTLDPDALRRVARDLLAASASTADPDAALAVLEARARLRAARLQVEQAQRGELPSLSVGLTYAKGAGKPGLGNLSVSVTGSYTLYDGGRQQIAVQQAEAQADSAERALASAQSTAAQGLRRLRLDLERAAAAEQLAALRWERARLQAEQASRRHAAGVIGDTQLADAALPLQEAEDAAAAAVHALGRAYLALAIELAVDLREALAAMAG